MKLKQIILLGAMLTTCVQAAPQGDVSVQLEVFKVSIAKPDGKESFKPADSVLPGDILEYRAHYKNSGKATARGVEATLPVPAGNVVYVADSARPRNLLASTDGSRFDAAPLKRVVMRPDGQRETRAVPLAEYRSLRWQLGDLPAGASATVSSRMRVETLDVPDAGKTTNSTNRRADNNATPR